MIRLRPKPHDSLLPELTHIEKEFVKRFGREMTPEERRLYTLTKDFLEKPGFARRSTDSDCDDDQPNVKTEKAS